MLLADATLNIVVILADAMMMFSLIRDPLSYFRPYRNYFVAIYGAFLAFPAQELVLIFYPQDALLLFSTQLLVTAGGVIAILWGHTATRLYVYPETFSLKSVFKNPLRRIHSAYILYLIPIVVPMILAWGVLGTIDTGSTNTALYPLDGTISRTVVFNSLFLVAGALLVIAFTVYPFLVLVHLRAQLKDHEVRNALKVFSSCFGAIAVIVVVFNALPSVGYNIVALGHLASMILLVVAVRAFRKPSFLKAFLGIVPPLGFSTLTSYDRLVLLYSGEEKFDPLSRYIAEGVGRRNRVILFHQGDEATVREELARRGLNVRQALVKGNLRLFPLGSLYLTKGVLDETPLESCREFASEARTLGMTGLRIIIDYEDYILRPSQVFVEHLANPGWTSPDHYTHVLMTFTRDAFQGQEDALALLRSRVPVLDLSESLDVFSRTVGLSHPDITGKKILLEYDPLSNYENVLKSMMSEAASNLERMVVFTRKDSPIYSLVEGEIGLKTFVLTARVSYPKVEKEDRVLLPAFDSSLILDALNRTIEAYATASLTIVFDNISHYVFTLGAERAYSLVRQALELMISNKITAVFLLNSGAHDRKTISTFESIFDIDVICTAGTRRPEVKKTLSVTAN